MKVCPLCEQRYSVQIEKCPNCGFTPFRINGFESYAPELAFKGGGFKSNYFSDLAKLENNNFWFVARNRLITWMLRKYSKNFESFLEVGCGTGYVLSGIEKKFPNSKLHGSEIFINGLGYAADRLPSAKLMQMDARTIPYESEFDVIGAFDVLEHIKEDEKVLQQVFNALKPMGFLLLTVPQHQWLWSPIDEYAQHQRRYSSTDLHGKLETSGFMVIRSTSFVTMLLPAMIISRFIQKKIPDCNFDAKAELKIAPLINALFSTILYIEHALIKFGMNFSCGGSRIVIAQKIENNK